MTDDRPFIGTPQGRFYFMDRESLDAIDLELIARSLSRTARYRGMTPRFYSVAEHSLHGAEVLQRASDAELALLGVQAQDWGWFGPRERLRAQLLFLLHDAPEAYVGDIPEPLKRQLRGLTGLTADVPVQTLENDINARIHRALSIPAASGWERGVIKAIDQAMFQWEYRHFFGRTALDEVMASGFGVGDTSLHQRVAETVHRHVEGTVEMCRLVEEGSPDPHSHLEMWWLDRTVSVQVEILGE